MRTPYHRNRGGNNHDNRLQRCLSESERRGIDRIQQLNSGLNLPPRWGTRRRYRYLTMEEDFYPTEPITVMMTYIDRFSLYNCDHDVAIIHKDQPPRIIIACLAEVIDFKYGYTVSVSSLDTYLTLTNLTSLTVEFNSEPLVRFSLDGSENIDTVFEEVTELFSCLHQHYIQYQPNVNQTEKNTYTQTGRVDGLELSDIIPNWFGSQPSEISGKNVMETDRVSTPDNVGYSGVGFRRLVRGLPDTSLKEIVNWVILFEGTEVYRFSEATNIGDTLLDSLKKAIEFRYPFVRFNVKYNEPNWEKEIGSTSCLDNVLPGGYIEISTLPNVTRPLSVSIDGLISLPYNLTENADLFLCIDYTHVCEEINQAIGRVLKHCDYNEVR